MAGYANDVPNQNNCDNQAADFLNKASEACAAGDLLLGMHLYLAAYEKAVADSNPSTGLEVAALREAWRLACDLKERSMAEYVFEKLEPYLTGQEIAECAMKLQELALDRLEQYGFSRQELEEMAESISQDFLGDGARVVKVESVSIPAMGALGAAGTQTEATIVAEASTSAPGAEDGSPIDTNAASMGLPTPPSGEKAGNKPGHVDMGVANADDFNPYDEFRTSSVGTSYHAATTEGSGAYVFTRDTDRANELARSLEQADEDGAEDAQTVAEELAVAKTENPVAPIEHVLHEVAEKGKEADSKPALSMPAAPAPSDEALPSIPNVAQFDTSVLNYHTLVGYDEAVSVMRDFGVGLHNDPSFISFVTALNAHHGLDRMPAADTLLFRAPASEDALRFADATIGELGLPVLRMSMEEGVGGAPVLCLTAQGNNRPRMNHAHNRFDGPGILVIEDLDNWIMPEMPENPEGLAGFVMANISRGAREAVGLIRSAVEDPNVVVLATASTVGEPDPYFYELLEPITIVDIGYPNEKERTDIWAEIARDHPSMRGIAIEDLVRYSEGMVRYDMYMAAREAIEDAYKMGLVHRSLLPVTQQNLFDKLAACQPLDSEKYHELEEAVLDDFRNDLDHLEDLLGGSN